MAAIPLKSWYFYNIVRGIAEAPAIEKTRGAAIGIVAAVSLSHLLNDILQSLIPAVYPILKTTYRLDFGQSLFKARRCGGTRGRRIYRRCQYLGTAGCSAGVLRTRRGHARYTFFFSKDCCK
jgi:hypothetical protein